MGGSVPRSEYEEKRGERILSRFQTLSSARSSAGCFINVMPDLHETWEMRSPVTCPEHTAMPVLFVLCLLLRTGREGRDKEPGSNPAGMGGQGWGERW